MIDRFIDCLCHPKWIGKYNKDKPGIVFLMILFFFMLYLLVFGIRCYTEKPFDDYSYQTITSALVNQKELQVEYKDHKLEGKSYVIKEEGFNVFILPQESPTNYKVTDISIVLKEEEARIYLSSFQIASLSYTSLRNFEINFQEICNNDAVAIYDFKNFIADILDSASLSLQSITFAEGVITEILFYLVIVLCCSFYAMLINPTIDAPIRYKLCFYDGLIYFVVGIFASLFNAGWLSYISFVVPIIYVSITFRHIVKVVVQK